MKRTYAIISILFCLALVFNNGCKTSEKEKGKTSVPLQDINSVKEAHTQELMSLPGVVGVYIGQQGDGKLCIVVMVKKMTSDLEQRIPKTLEGYTVRVDETGEIKPME